MTDATKPSTVNGTPNDVDEATPLENLLAVSVIIVRQAVDFLEENITSDEQLSYRSKYIPGSTIGVSLKP